MMTDMKPINTATPTQHANLFAALAAAQMEMGPALKQSNNPHFKSKYADLGNVMEACLPALNRNGIAVVQPIGMDDLGGYVKTILLHASGETMDVCRVQLIVSKNDMQGFGSAVTYARRYGLMAMAGIAPEDDDGNAAVAAAPRSQEPEPAAVFDEIGAFNRGVADALKSIARETTLDGLSAFYADLYRTNRAVAVDGKVVAAKDKRKGELAPITADEIPY